MGSSGPASRDGDWRCDGCGNRNYAFRSFCNRCKQPRLLVDSKTPSDSKWLPRIGDWICAGCSNNNYASRDKCNKCGTPKEVSALPAMALPGAAMAAPTFARNALGQAGGLGLGMNAGSTMLFHHAQPNWPFSGTTLGGSLADNVSWRPGDWLCICGYHNYSSRSTCKQCQAPMPPGVSISALPPMPTGVSISALPPMPPGVSISALPPMPPGVSIPASTLPLLQSASALTGVGMKRPASDDMGNDLKRLYTGGEYAPPPFQNQPLNLDSMLSSGSSFGLAEVGNAPPPSWPLQPPPHMPGLTLVPAIVGKGAKQWRSGDWMCAGCNNHNFASRDTCNRCGGKRESMSQVLSVA